MYVFVGQIPEVSAFGNVLADKVDVPFQFPAYRALVDTYLPSNGGQCPSLLHSQIDCVSLLTGQLVIHCNTKLIDPGGTSVPLFVFCVASLPQYSSIGLPADK